MEQFQTVAAAQQVDKGGKRHRLMESIKRPFQSQNKRRASQSPSPGKRGPSPVKRIRAGSIGNDDDIIVIEDENEAESDDEVEVVEHNARIGPDRGKGKTKEHSKVTLPVGNVLPTFRVEQKALAYVLFESILALTMLMYIFLV